MPLIVMNRGLGRRDREDLHRIRVALERIAMALEGHLGSRGGTSLRSYYSEGAPPVDESRDEASIVTTDEEFLALMELAERAGPEVVRELYRREQAGELEGFYEELQRREEDRSG